MLLTGLITSVFGFYTPWISLVTSILSLLLGGFVFTKIGGGPGNKLPLVSQKEEEGRQEWRKKVGLDDK